MAAAGSNQNVPARRGGATRGAGLLAVLAMLATLLTVLVGAPEAAAVPEGFQDEVLWDGLLIPSEVAFAPDGKVFVSEITGRVYRYDGLEDESRTLVADLTTNVHNWQDRGLLGLAVDPNFGPERPYIYVQYTYDHRLGDPEPAPRWGEPGELFDPCPDPPEATTDGCVVSGRLSKIVLSEPGGAMVSEEVLVEDWCAQFPSHSIGTIIFGTDGMLYAGGGDGASYNAVDYGQFGGSLPGTPVPANPCGDAPGGRGTELQPETAVGGALRSQAAGLHARQSTTGKVTLDGTIIRVDPDTGLGVPGNPWYGQPGMDENEERILAYGLRNPFRFSMRGGTNEIWLGDVGWVDWEEINRIPDATSLEEPLNFGWPCYEGSERNGSYDGNDLGVCEDLYAAGSRRRRGSLLRIQPLRDPGSERQLPHPGLLDRGRRLLQPAQRTGNHSVSGGVRRGPVLHRLQPAVHLGDAARGRRTTGSVPGRVLP